MKFKQYLDSILGQKTEMALLRYLVNYKNEASVRELARAVQVGPTNVSRALVALEKAHVLVAKKVGTAILYRLNNGHFLVDKVIKPLFGAEKEYWAEIGRFVRKNIKFEVESVIVFGSVGRGTEKTSSDIDVLFILPNQIDCKKAELELLELNARAANYFGNFFSWVILSRKEFGGRFRKNDQLVGNIIKDGVVIVGKTISELL